LHLAQELQRASGLPIFAVGYSLGGNIVLKLAGELGEQGRELFAGVCAVSAPIDLAASVEATGLPRNILYRRRFVARLKERVRIRHPLAPDLFPLEPLDQVRTIYDFDDLYTAKIFGFGTAVNYYRTQSSNQFLEHIRIPTFLVQAKDDPMVPFAMYSHPAFTKNPNLHLVAVDHGGHLGFLDRNPPRLWLDTLITDWLVGRIS
jgi:uncharacterized protein